MDDELSAWAVTRDPEKTRQLMEVWDDPSRSVEEVAHDLGLHPDSDCGQRDAIFLYGTPEGERIFMWEPGPDADESTDNSFDFIAADENPNPWDSAVR